MQTSPFINGQWVTPKTDQQLECINPATEKTIAFIHAAGIEEVNEAVSAATNASKQWSEITGAERAQYINTIADLMERDKQELIQLSSKNNGKPNKEAIVDLDDAIATYRYYAGKAIELDQLQNQNVSLSVEGISSYRRLEPVGVVALIVPWNFPLVTSAWKIAPALAAGCTIVLKPAAPTALIELELGRIAQEAQIPAGVLNIVPGTGEVVGNRLTHHRSVDKISFTGSNNVGSMVMTAAAATSKNISLELGGKSPILVFKDADIDQAVEAVLQGAYWNAGQMCSATTRLLVEKSIEEIFLTKLLDAIAKLKIGPAYDESSTTGPMTTKVQYHKVLEYFEIATKEQLNLIIGGKAAEGFEKGFYIEPTFYKDVPTDSRLWKEEIFGPVLCSRSFETEEEAIELANDSEYGLAATIISTDEVKLRRVSKALRAGHIWWNMSQIVPPETSWGGFKQSGIGR